VQGRVCPGPSYGIIALTVSKALDHIRLQMDRQEVRSHGNAARIQPLGDENRGRSLLRTGQHIRKPRHPRGERFDHRRLYSGYLGQAFRHTISPPERVYSITHPGGPSERRPRSRHFIEPIVIAKKVCCSHVSPGARPWLRRARIMSAAASSRVTITPAFAGRYLLIRIESEHAVNRRICPPVCLYIRTQRFA